MNQRVALITGCSKKEGLGAATARRLVRAGVTVVVTDINMEGARGTSEKDPPPAGSGIAALVAELKGMGGQAEYFLGDVSVEADANRLVDEAVKRFGRLDILVNNAAAPHGKEFNDIVEVPLDAYDRVMSVNARGSFAMMKAAVPHMRKNKWGRIVNVSSIAGKAGIAKQAVYAGSKAALIGMTRCLAIDLGPDGITVNAVCPGSMQTSRVFSDALRRWGPERLQEEMKKKAHAIPVGNVALPEEVASVIAFLCSEEASHVTSQAISVDGGRLTI